VRRYVVPVREGAARECSHYELLSYSQEQARIPHDLRVVAAHLAVQHELESRIIELRLVRPQSCHGARRRLDKPAEVAHKMFWPWYWPNRLWP
jgi:hypothetical protein